MSGSVCQRRRLRRGGCDHVQRVRLGLAILHVGGAQDRPLQAGLHAEAVHVRRRRLVVPHRRQERPHHGEERAFAQRAGIVFAARVGGAVGPHQHELRPGLPRLGHGRGEPLARCLDEEVRGQPQAPEGEVVTQALDDGVGARDERRELLAREVQQRGVDHLEPPLLTQAGLHLLQGIHQALL